MPNKENRPKEPKSGPLQKLGNVLKPIVGSFEQCVFGKEKHYIPTLSISHSELPSAPLK